IVLGSVLLAPEVRWILSLGKKDYAGTEMLVAPVMLGYGFKFAYTNYVNVEQYEKKTALVTLGTFVAAGFNLVTNFIFIPIFGYMAAAYTTCASFVVLLLMHYLICRKSGLTVMYDNKFNFIILAVMSTISFFIPFLYPYMIVRIVIAFIIGIITLTGMYKIKKAYF
ncbi:MAG: polysaccharide biosynthesis C-terminal domain-containing protein, partial [Lachnospiraceae bacterium]|nr:polysaccharide biosynthesis C-terminal domain-containing protein [Lachnospiraceae bacterium]